MKTLKTNIRNIGLLACLATFAIGCGGQEQAEQQQDAKTGTETEKPMVTVEQLWATDPVMRTPESVLYHPEEDVLFVANINGVNREQPDGDGFISKLSPEGEVIALEWATGLNDPKGMGIYDGKLYVSDISEVAVIDLATGEVEKTYKDETAQFLNDITVDTASGSVFITDMNKSRLYQIQDGMLKIVMEDSTTLQRPNGLFMDDDNQLMVLSMGAGRLMAASLADFNVKNLADGFPGADGIAKTEQGNYVISNWNGEVYHLTWPTGEKVKLIDTKDQKINAADIDYAVGKQMLLVPTFYDNRVVAYKLSEG